MLILVKDVNIKTCVRLNEYLTGEGTEDAIHNTFALTWRVNKGEGTLKEFG